jgi:hypothetical protein
MQGHARDGHAAVVAEEVEQIPARGFGVLVQELSDGTREPRQELTVGTSAQAVVGGLDHFFGREVLLSRGSRATEAEQSSEVSDGETELAMEQKVAEQSDGVIVASTALQEGKGSVQDGALGVGQVFFGDIGVCQPTGKVCDCCNHGAPREHQAMKIV